MMAHGIDENFSHEPAIGAVRIAFDSYCVGLHFGDNEMRTAGFERLLDRGGQTLLHSRTVAVLAMPAPWAIFSRSVLRVVKVEPMRA